MPKCKALKQYSHKSDYILCYNEALCQMTIEHVKPNKYVDV